MASANVELVTSICAAWERGDYEWTDWEDPGIEFAILDGPTPGTWHVAAGITEGWGDFLGAWAEFRGELEESA